MKLLTIFAALCLFAGQAHADLMTIDSELEFNKANLLFGVAESSYETKKETITKKKDQEIAVLQSKRKKALDDLKKCTDHDCVKVKKGEARTYAEEIKKVKNAKTKALRVEHFVFIRNLQNITMSAFTYEFRSRLEQSQEVHLLPTQDADPSCRGGRYVTCRWLFVNYVHEDKVFETSVIFGIKYVNNQAKLESVKESMYNLMSDRQTLGEMIDNVGLVKILRRRGSVNYKLGFVSTHYMGYNTLSVDEI